MTDPQVIAAAEAVRARVPVFPPVAVVLGSGLAPFAATLVAAVEIGVADIPSWPGVTVPGHEGRLVVGRSRTRPVAVVAGRTHLYEGAGADAVSFPVRVLARLGVKILILTNASGALHDGLEPGTLAVIDDHLNLTGSHPLIGRRQGEPGAGFVDMADAYAPRLRALADAAAAAAGLALGHGVYAGVCGPSYETPAEVRALRALGADLVGMSTVHETIVARQLGLEVLGLSLVTNPGAGVAGGALRHDDVLQAGRRGSAAFATLLEEILARL